MGSKERVGPRPFNPNPSLFALACPKWSPAGGTMVVRAREAVGWNFSARKEKGMGKGTCAYPGCRLPGFDSVH